jgi:hypothetical protein
MRVRVRMRMRGRSVSIGGREICHDREDQGERKKGISFHLCSDRDGSEDYAIVL